MKKAKKILRVYPLKLDTSKRKLFIDEEKTQEYLNKLTKRCYLSEKEQKIRKI